MQYVCHNSTWQPDRFLEGLKACFGQYSVQHRSKVLINWSQTVQNHLKYLELMVAEWDHLVVVLPSH